MYLDEIVANWLKSPSQKIRRMTEFWAGENIYCPSCWESIIQYSNNKPVADFYCEKCREDFELKAKKSNSLWKIVPDGSYKTMIERLESSTNPSFFFLTYTPEFEISNFLIIPKFFIRPENIIQAPRVLKDRG
jgi:type II restriction enzyme